MRRALIVVVSVLCAMILGGNAQCINDCSNHGDCNSGNCVCEEGWTAEDCSTYQCDKHADGCSGHGQCRSGTCVCHSNYGGYNCASLTNNCPDHCKGHGSCLDGVCECDTGYTGTDCGLVDPTVHCPNNCSGHGFCDVSASTPTCYCMPSYWTGEACDVEVSKCPAELNFCTGHGICGPTDPLKENSAWVCDCEAGFCGEKCDSVCPQCKNNCTGHGMCIGNACECFPGFGGEDCSSVVQVSSCPNNCSGHGRCRESNGNYSCVCDTGYSGATCTLTSNNCPGNCGGNGECLPSGSCSCFAGFTGANCQTVAANCLAKNNCSANGVCQDGTCRCSPGFSGDDCSQACHTGGLSDVGCNAHLGHGICVDGECVCKDGEWTGVGCQTPAHESTLAKVTSSSNPLGIIVVSIVGAAACLLLAGYVFNYVRGKRGLNAVPGVDALRSSMQGGDDYESVPENRYASNY